MDFTFTADQDAAAELARTMCSSGTPGPTSGSFDDRLWLELAAAGLLSLHLADPYGDDVGMIAACRVLVELGRVAADIPAAGHIAATAMLADHAGAQQYLTALATGSPVFAMALAEGVDPAPERPLTTACRLGDSWRLDGTKTMISHGGRAGIFVVSAGTEDGPGLFVVAGDDSGVSVTTQRSSAGHPVAELHLDQVMLPADRYVGGAECVVRAHHAHTTTTAAVQFGVCERAVELTAEHTATREQFGRPLGALQAVTQRLGDAYIDLACLRLALWQAAWRWEAAEPLSPAVEVAGYWSAEAGYRISRSAIHLHGGAGVDLDGQLHHYFSAATRHEVMLGGVTRQALAIGRHFGSSSSGG